MPAPPVPAASFPLSPPLGQIQLVDPKTGRFTTLGLSFMTELWAGIQGNGGVLDKITAIIVQFLQIPLPAGMTISGNRVVTVNIDGDLNYPALDNLADGLGAVGITSAAATVAGQNVTIQRIGRMDDPSWSWIPGKPVYCIDQGQLSQTPPTGAGNWSLQVATAIEPTAILIEFRELVFLS